MGVVLPGWADELLDLIGVSWPNVDEDDYREMAHSMREFADDIDEGANEAHAAIQGLVGSAGGSLGVEALNAHWGKINGKHLKGLADCGRTAGTAMDGVAILIEGAKIGALVQLGILAAEVIAAQAAAPFTLGLSELGAMGATQATRLILKRLFKEVCQQVAEQVVSIALTPVEEALGAMVGDLVVQLGANALGVQDGVDLSRTAKAGKDGFHQGVQDAKDSAKEASANPKMGLLSAGGSGGGGTGGGAGTGFSFDEDEHDNVVTGLQSASGTFRNKAGGKIGRARSHHGRTRGKDAIADAANVVLDKVVDGIEDGVKKTAKHLDDDMTRGVKQMAKNHRENDKSLADHFNGLGKGGKKDPKAPNSSRGSGEHGRRGSTVSSKPGRAANGKIDPGIDGRKEVARPHGEKACELDPIDVTTGEMLLPQTDVDLPAALPLVLQRTHLSSYRAGGWFGPSWASTLDQRLQMDRTGVAFAGEDGMRLVYPTLELGGTVMPTVGPRWPLSWDDVPGGAIRITQPGTGRALIFAPPAAAELLDETHELPLDAIEDRNEQRITFIRDDDGAPLWVEHSGGYRIDVELDPELQRIAALHQTDPSAPDSGATELVRYRYDDAGNLSELTNSSGMPMQFTYDEADRITSWTDSNATTYCYTYDAQGRVVHTEGSDGALSGALAYDTETRVTRVTNALGQVAVYRYNSDHKITQHTDALGHTTVTNWDDGSRHPVSVTDPLGRTTHYTYDDVGNLTALTRPDGSTLWATFNDAGLPVEVVGPDGGTWRFTYDTRGNRLAATDPAGATTTYTYDRNGNPSTVVDALGHTSSITCNLAGLPLSVTDQLGATTSYVRDHSGRVVSVTDPLGNATRFAWTVEGEPTERVAPDGAAEAWRWDGEGNLLSHTDSVGNITKFEYTHFGLQAARLEPNGVRYEFTYDSELRLIAVRNPQGHSWTYKYDSAGHLVAETDFNGRTITYVYDAAGQLIERTNGAGQSIRLYRDSLGRVTEQRTEAGELTVYAYDAADRITHAANAEAVISRKYDLAGRLLTESTNGHALTYVYDILGRRTQRATPSGTISSWSWDAAGNPTALTSSAGALTFSFDAAGRETQRHLGSAATLTQRWDASSRLSSQTVTSTYAGRSPRTLQELAAVFGERTIAERSYTYRADGHLTSLTDNLAGTRRFTLAAGGRVTAVTADGWTEAYAYDSAGNLTRAAVPGSDGAEGEHKYSGTLVQSAGRHTYEYDAQGRVVRRSRRLLNGQRHTWRYTWSAEDRLTHVTTPDGAHWQYSYDPFGRRIAKRRLADDRTTVVEETRFTWDDTRLAEESTHVGQSTTWDYQPGTHEPLSQTITQAEYDSRFYAIVTDLVGTPTELLDNTGNIVWRSRASLWGLPVKPNMSSIDCPIRFQGQYLDSETGTHYNYYRHYDPDTARYISPDPLGLDPAPHHHGYVPNPYSGVDPLGLAKKDRGCVKPVNWTPKGVKAFGHTFSDHGMKNSVQKMADRARNKRLNPKNATGEEKPQGQWLDDDAAAKFLHSHHDPSLTHASQLRVIPIPEGLGRVVREDGSFVPATHAKLIPSASGYYKTAYPVILE
ncbi:DUF6531 domain-containing protein [Streptomyces sp. NPDC015125]|uniref:DUF6531 domain-containing protein n=1 Tax=Streptomyces sp. NPDC015125 TaxID=3364938 RepID=UPI0036FF8808